MDNTNFISYLKDFTKKNKSSIITIFVAFAGYVYYLISIFTATENQTDYLPTLPMLLSLGVYIFSVMYILDQLRFYLSPKAFDIRLIFHSEEKQDIGNPPVCNFLLPLLSLIYRVFTYTGIFVGILTLILRYLRLYSPDMGGSLIYAGILFSLLYESYHGISFLLAKLLDKLLGKKASTLIVKIASLLFGVFLLILFSIEFFASFDFLAGFGRIAGSRVWEIIPISRWSFDAMYIALGRNMGMTPVYILINFVLVEAVLYMYYIFKNRLKDDEKEDRIGNEQ